MDLPKDVRQGGYVLIYRRLCLCPSPHNLELDPMPFLLLVMSRTVSAGQSVLSRFLHISKYSLGF